MFPGLSLRCTEKKKGDASKKTTATIICYTFYHDYHILLPLHYSLVRQHMVNFALNKIGGVHFCIVVGNVLGQLQNALLRHQQVF